MWLASDGPWFKPWHTALNTASCVTGDPNRLSQGWPTCSGLPPTDSILEEAPSHPLQPSLLGRLRGHAQQWLGITTSHA